MRHLCVVTAIRQVFHSRLDRGSRKEPCGASWSNRLARYMSSPAIASRLSENQGARTAAVRRSNGGLMKKPTKRSDVPPRNKDNNKRRLGNDITPEVVGELLKTVTYKGSPKHKRNPGIFNLEPFNGVRGDATLCDDHANFQPADMAKIPGLIQRGLKAGLIGSNLWTIGENGWIFECRLTNAAQNEYHGYPVRPTEAIAEPVYRRFKAWAEAAGDAADKQAAENCAALYGFR